MMPVSASAPGKLVLLGEYAVIDGQPALAMAVNRHARVTALDCARESSRVEVAQLGLAPVPFGWAEDGRLRWLGAGAAAPEFARCRHLLDQAFEREGGSWPEAAGLQLSIDTAELFDHSPDGPIKLGLGSSAAVSLALGAVLDTLLAGGRTLDSGIDRLQGLLAGYRSAQGGRGSGIDLAASLCGGVIRYRLLGDVPEVAPVCLPPQLQLVFIWSGRPASTAHFLAAHAEWCSRRTAAAEALHARMGACVEQALDCMAHADAEGFMTCINSYRGLMGKIGEQMRVPVMSDAHLALARLADRHGLAYKPSGAGGGDLGILAASEPDRLALALADVRARGFRILDLETAATGLVLNAPSKGRGTGRG